VQRSEESLCFPQDGEILREVYPEPFDDAQDRLRRRAQNDMTGENTLVVHHTEDEELSLRA